MQILLNILLLIAIQLPLHPFGNAATSYGWSVIQNADHTHQPVGYPTGHPDLYAIHHQAESPAELTNRVPQAQPTTERKYEPYKSSAPESVIKQRLIFWIRYGDLIEPGLTARKLIFPFHFFL